MIVVIGALGCIIVRCKGFKVISATVACIMEDRFQF